MSAGQPGLWDWAVEAYGRPGVADACLRLQDRAGVDVPLLLCACWLAARGRRLDVATAQKLHNAVAPWQREVVTPLRHARRFLKRGSSAVHERSRDCVVELAERVTALELDAERAQLETLEALCATLTTACEPARVLAETSVTALLGLNAAQADVAWIIASCIDPP